MISGISGILISRSRNPKINICREFGNPTPAEMAPGIHCIGEVGLRAGLDAFGERKNVFLCPGIVPQFLGCLS
jgi:hypothetical protein